jgi:hypothetical protein
MGYLHLWKCKPPGEPAAGKAWDTMARLKAVEIVFYDSVHLNCLFKLCTIVIAVLNYRWAVVLLEGLFYPIP